MANFERKDLAPVKTERAFSAPPRGTIVKQKMMSIDADAFYPSIHLEYFANQTFSHEVDAVILVEMLILKRSTKDPVVLVLTKLFGVAMGYGNIAMKKMTGDTIIPPNQKLLQDICIKGKEVLESVSKPLNPILEIVDGFLCLEQPLDLEKINSKFKYVKFVEKLPDSGERWTSGYFIHGNQYVLFNSTSHLGKGKGFGKSKKSAPLVRSIYYKVLSLVMEGGKPKVEDVINGMYLAPTLENCSIQRYGKPLYLNPETLNWEERIPRLIDRDDLIIGTAINDIDKAFSS